MRSWLSNWKKRRELNVEAELRAAKPEPQARFVKALAARVNPRPASPVRTRTRFGVAAAVTATMVAVVGATGGFSSAASSISSLTHSVTHQSASSGGTQATGSGSGPVSAAAQYGAAPTVSNDFSPNPAWPGASVTVNGSNFTGLNQVTAVKIGSENAAYSVTGPYSLTVTVPADSTGGDITVSNTSGDGASTTPLVVEGAATITHVATNGVADTSEGGVGSTVVITGTNLKIVSAVTFNKKAATITSQSATSITTTIPVGTPTNKSGVPGTLALTSPGGGTSTSYTVDSNAPTVASFKVAGGTKFAQPNDTVIVTGKNLGTGTTLSFTASGGGFVAGTSQAAPTGITNGTQWQAVVPANAVTGPVQVSNSAGSSTSKASLTIVLDASPTTLSPNYGKAGASAGKVGDKITISGTSLTNINGGDDTVTFPGGATVSVKPKNDTTLVAPVPFGATGTGHVTVDNGTGNAGTSSDTFYVLTTPSISSLSANHGASGSSVVITGQHLVGTKSVTFNAKAAKFTVDSDTQITAIVPTGATKVPAKNAGLTVTNSVAPVNTPFTVDDNAPTIKVVSAVGSSKALSGAAANDTIDITGTYLDTNLTVTFGSGSSASVTHAGSPTSAQTTVAVTVPNGAETGVIKVDNGHGTASTAKPFTIIGAPTIVAFSPGYGVAGKTKVNVVGDNISSVASVDFVGTGATPTTTNAKASKNKDGSITVTVPKSTDAESRLVVKIADPATGGFLTANSGNLVFDIVSAPTVGTVDDQGNSHVAGQQIIVNGSNFQGITSVTFGKVSASFSPVVSGGSIDTSRLTVTIPSGATSGPITVTNAAGKASTAAFSILAVTKVSPTHAKVGKPFSIAGTGFNPGTLASVSIAPSGGGSSTGITPGKGSNDKLLKLAVPTLSAGSYTITITDTLGTVTTSFTVDPS